MPSKIIVKDYYLLTKPGIIRGNLITAGAGFLLASQQNFDPARFIAMLAGLALVIAAGCVSNNYLDRGIDSKMARTAKRALVSGRISGRSALAYAAVLGLLGVIILAIFTTPLALVFALVGYVAYVFLYGYYKRRSTHSTLIGSISGAIPPVVGYTAVTNQIDTAALVLFIILVCWQMPHFFAIGVFRLKDYAAASLPILPVKKGIAETRKQTIIYIIAYLAASLSLTAFGYTGFIYAGLMTAIGIYWLFAALKQPESTDATKWGKQVFLVSLLAITLQCILIAIDALFLA